MRHLPVKCPRCGVTGYVRINQMDLQFRCKPCQALFFIDSAGRCTLGKKAAGQVDLLDWSAVSKHSSGQDPLAFLEGIPREAKLVLGGAVIVALALLAYRALFRGGPDLPTSLNDRAVYVSRAFVDNDPARLKSICASGTTRAAESWLKTIRPSYWSPAVVGSRIDVDVEILFQNARDGRACVVATVMIPAISRSQVDTRAPAPAIHKSSPNGAREPNMPRIELLLYWSLDSNGEWRFDGDNTLKNS